MAHLPYVPSPYPDEILGSWLARISLHNGRGAWRPLLETTGHGRRIEKPLFDLIDYEDKLERLLNGLGTNYEQALINLTTLPYWLVFDASSTPGAVLPGTTAIPQLGSNNHADIRVLGKIGRSSGRALRPRYCPQCLDEDHGIHGEPYWHRAHQLPTVLACPKHQCAVLTACPKCKREFTTATAAKRLTLLPGLRCQCGHDLRKTTPTESPTASYVKLARYSMQVLNCAQPNWHGRHVRTHLRSILSPNDQSPKIAYDTTLINAFNLTRSANGMLSGSISQLNKHGANMLLRSYLSKAQAPECCALLVALDVDIEDAVRGFKNRAGDDNSYIKRPRLDSGAMNVGLARTEIARRVLATPHKSVAAHVRLYWFLRIYDADWLGKQFPQLRTNPLPSVNDDRRQIECILGDKNLPSKQRLELIRVGSIGIRARLRDESWVRGQLKELQDEKRMRTQQRRSSARADCATAIMNALQLLLRDEGRPTRIFYTMLAAKVGLTHSQVTTVIQSHPSLRDAIAAANKDKPRRQLLWAAQQLAADGVALSSKKIYRRASLPFSPKTNNMVREIVNRSNDR